MSKKQCRVAVTGVGAVSGFGSGSDKLWQGTFEGRTCVGTAGTSALFPADHVLRMALQAGREAMNSADFRPDSGRTFLALGTNVGRLQNIEMPGQSPPDGLCSLLCADFPEQWADHFALARELQSELELEGDAVAVTGACSSSSLALGHGFDLISAGFCDQVVAGGVDVLTQLKSSGHRLLGSAGHSGGIRPFDVRRDGTAFCEGAGFMILESLEKCLARGVRPLALLSGYGVGTDTGSLTAPDPEGRGACTAMQAALSDAGVSARDVDHIQAHGTGTRLNDLIEAKAIGEVFGSDLDRMTVSADKGAIGHTLGASGVLSAILTVTMMTAEQVLPVFQCEEPDPECALPLVLGQPVHGPVRRALCNSFGFGGSNVSLVFERAEDLSPDA